MRTILAIYPPGKKYMRGEERCQSNVSASVSTEIRACNDLGYVAAVMRMKQWRVGIKDFQTENISENKAIAYINGFEPDVLFVSVTNATLMDDLELCEKIRNVQKDIVIILKGAVFFNPPRSLLELPALAVADYLIAEEAECVMAQLLEAHYNQSRNVEDVPRIFFRKAGKWESSRNHAHCDALDALPFPARDLMNNELYVRPDTGRPMATISTSRGCPSNCSFCLTPPMSGRKVRERTPQSIFNEISECVSKYGIVDFFFRADTFTINRNNVMELCHLIQEHSLSRKISWVANARATTLDGELLREMKSSGCWLIAVGFESGSDETLKKTKKGSSVEINRKAAKLIHDVGIKLFGFYMIGFPWETEKHINETRKLIADTHPDFIEVHIATPFYGTALYDECFPEQDNPTIIGCDYFQNISSVSHHFSSSDLVAMRKDILYGYLFSWRYICARMKEAFLSPTVFGNYLKYVFRLLVSFRKNK